MYQVITIEREYASGGNEIGKKLAGALGYKLYDRNLLTKAAQELQIANNFSVRDKCFSFPPRPRLEETRNIYP